MQLSANDVDTTLAVGALNNIIANNNLTAQFGSINTNALLANNTQAALNETLGPINLYPLRVAAGVTAQCTEAFLTPATYYALETAYSGTLTTTVLFNAYGCSNAIHTGQACTAASDNMCRSQNRAVLWRPGAVSVSPAIVHCMIIPLPHSGPLACSQVHSLQPKLDCMLSATVATMTTEVYLLTS